MEQISYPVQIMMWANLAVVIMFGFLVFCWVCERLNKLLGVSGNRRTQRRAQREADEQQAIQNAIATAVAAQVAQLQQSQSST